MYSTLYNNYASRFLNQNNNIYIYILPTLELFLVKKLENPIWSLLRGGGGKSALRLSYGGSKINPDFYTFLKKINICMNIYNTHTSVEKMGLGLALSVTIKQSTIDSCLIQFSVISKKISLEITKR